MEEFDQKKAIIDAKSAGQAAKEVYEFDIPVIEQSFIDVLGMEVEITKIKVEVAVATHREAL